MKYHTLILLLTFNLCFQVSAKTLLQTKEIAITFDDSPRAATGYFSGAERAQKLITELQRHKVGPVVFFSNSSKLNKEGIERIGMYSQSGHVIANHTHSHPDFNRTSGAEYVKNFLLADSKLSQIKGFKKLFRFPYLREGNTEKKRDLMRTALKQQGYMNGYITVNTYDWYIETLYQTAIKEGTLIDQNRMREFYVQVMMESIEYYDDMAQTHLGRSPKHVILLHEMDISALYIGALVNELRDKGWKIIPATQAYTDDIANYKLDKPLKYNPGRIGEIAYAKGQKKDLWHKNLDEEYLNKRFLEEVLSTKH